MKQLRFLWIISVIFAATSCGNNWLDLESSISINFSFPSKAKGWSNVQTTVAFNAYEPSKLLQSLYAEEDIRAKDRQFFHSFFKVQEGNKTIFEVFNPAPYFWLAGEGNSLSAPWVNQLGVYQIGRAHV